MNFKAAIQVATISVVLLSPTCVLGRITGFSVVNEEWNSKFDNLPVEKFCKMVSELYNVPVSMEKGIQVSISSDGEPSKLPAALERILKPHGLHAHFDSMGIFITRKPIPYNVTHLAGGVQVKLAIPVGRTQRYHDDFSGKWVQGSSTINARWKQIDETPLTEAVEKKLEALRELYKFTQEPTSVTRNGKSYLVIQYREPMTVVYKGKEVTLNVEDMMHDVIHFKNGNYMYTVSHSYPLAAAKAGAGISKRILDTIEWEQTTKYQRVDRLRWGH